jgi:hypothetical protein
MQLGHHCRGRFELLSQAVLLALVIGVNKQTAYHSVLPALGFVVPLSSFVIPFLVSALHFGFSFPSGCGELCWMPLFVLEGAQEVLELPELTKERGEKLRSWKGGGTRRKCWRIGKGGGRGREGGGEEGGDGRRSRR